MNQPQNSKGIPRFLTWMIERSLICNNSHTKKFYGKWYFVDAYLYGTTVQMNACPKTKTMWKELWAIYYLEKHFTKWTMSVEWISPIKHKFFVHELIVSAHNHLAPKIRLCEIEDNDDFRLVHNPCLPPPSI